MPLDSMEPQPTMKKTPLRTARGIVPKTMRRGRVIVPMMARPMRKWEIRCSVTWVAIVFFRVMESPVSVFVTSTSSL